MTTFEQNVITGHTPYHDELGTLFLVGTYFPRRCGIATFSRDLLIALKAEAVGSACLSVAINDRPEGYVYPNEVRFEINQNNIKEYNLAAGFLNMSQVDVVSLQHEYGIFGGNFGSHLFELLHNLRVPLVTTLHTVLSKPGKGQLEILQQLGRLSDRLVVMSGIASEILKDTYQIPEDKIEIIHHGIPDIPFIDPNFYKDKFDVEGRRVILTFGLISPGKGIEHFIAALPGIVEKHPEVIYIVLGETHPQIKDVYGEDYRVSLQRQARELGVEKHVVFHNRFVDLKELCEFLGAADIYVTPYVKEDQITSGTLAYALGAGKATISTPYLYAKEMLSEGRGVLVPFCDSRSLTGAVLDLLANSRERHSMRKRAYTFCRRMVWKEVARKYLDLFVRVKKEREEQPRPAFSFSVNNISPQELPEVNLSHLETLTDDTGILQHAKFTVPNRYYGYCTDDNARALIVATLARKIVSKTNQLIRLSNIYLSFLFHAFDTKSGRFRNFMSYDRKWLEEYGSDDCHGRSIWGLGIVVAMSETVGHEVMALNLFRKALRKAMETKAPRSWAFALIGIHAYLQRFAGDSEARRVRELLAQKLFDVFSNFATKPWPWFEEALTYDNGKIPHALILSGRWLHREDMLQTGLGSLSWLLEKQTDKKGHMVPVGNKGWFHRGGKCARFDQQPVEAESLIGACMEAYRITGEKKWLTSARCCFDWFLGKNDLHAPLYDYTTGGCRDGLHAEGANLNEGAESTLSFLLSLLAMYQSTGATSS